MAQNFLIRLGDDFLQLWEEGDDPLWTSIPSLAAHFTYEDADETAQELQEIGYDGCVTDIFGKPATAEVIQRTSRVSDGAVIRANDPEY